MTAILFGYYGYNNIGDDHLLSETIHLCHTLDHPFIIANGPVANNFPYFNRWNIISWIKHCIICTHVIFGGGSIFQSKTSIVSLLYYCIIVITSKCCNCRVILLCHGWGPFTKKWHEKLAKYIISMSHVKRSWRDTSAPFRKDPVFCDLVLTQKPGQSPKLHHKHIGIALSSPSDTNTIQQLLIKQSCQYTFLSPKKYPDKPYISLHTIWTHHNIPLGLVITDRYHIAIWASKHGIPWLTISNDPKLIALSSSANMPNISKASLITEISTRNHKQNNIKQWYISHKNTKRKIKDWLYEHISNS